MVSEKKRRMRTVLYKDRFVELYTDELILKSYFFPIPANKCIKIKHIRHLYYKKQEFINDLFTTKDWGMTLTPVWWACDLRRHISIGKTKPGFNVVIDNGSSIKKGFSVENVNEFLNALRPLTTANFENGFPKKFGEEKKAVIVVETPSINNSPLKPATELAEEALPLSEKEKFFYDNLEQQPNYASAPPAYEDAIRYPKLEKSD
uniref:Uncharacterized protein n=1 Tax=Panagrolaimus davidi TaxID=227884 RepID=A0A914P0S9_9BILA